MFNASMGGVGGAVSALTVQLNRKRRNQFYIYYIISPLDFLAFLNKMEFFMLPDSGERTGVVVTVFLSSVVYMDTINANVPASSNPVAFIYGLVLALMPYSVVIMLMCIISSRIYTMNASVPSWLKTFVYILRFRWLQKTKISSTESTSFDENTSRKAGKTIDSENTEKQKLSDTISWETVGRTLDTYCYMSCVAFILTLGVKVCG